MKNFGCVQSTRRNCLMLLLMLMIVSIDHTFAQQVVESTKATCEQNSAWLDLLMQKIDENNKIERVFVIARLGKGEKSRILNQRRLHNARTYLENRLKAEHIISAEGQRKDGEGRVEFYLGSELILISLIKRNADLCVNCFEPNPKYYGCGRK